MFSFSVNFNESKLINALKKFDSDKSKPIFLSIKNILFQKFQKTISSLYLIKKQYDFYHFITENHSNTTELTYEPDYILNAASLSYNEYGRKMRELFKKPDEKRIMDYSTWFVDPDLINQTDIRNGNYTNLHNQFFALHYTFPIIKAIYNTSLKNIHDAYDSIYFASDETNLFYEYPIKRGKQIDKGVEINEFVDQIPYYNNFKDFEFYRECVNKKGTIPKYYYFQCRDWWIQLVSESNNYYNNHDEQILITNPYKFAGLEKYGITVCLRFSNNEIDSSKKKLSAFCIDIDMTEIQNIFDKYNIILSGFFYILKVNSDYPVYYPYLNDTLYFSNLVRLEFDVQNQYYISELVDYYTITKKILHQMIKGEKDKSNSTLNNSSEIKNKLSGHYFKKKLNYTYEITPIYFYDDLENEDNKSHILSIIYVFKDSVIKDILSSFIRSLFPRIILQILFYLFLCLVLIEISWHLVSTIGFNIVRPIKNLRFQIKGMDAENTDFDKKLFFRKYKNESISKLAEEDYNINQNGGSNCINNYLRKNIESHKNNFMMNLNNLQKIKKIKSLKNDLFKKLSKKKNKL